jgi:dienelactone hydrolase
MKFLILLLTLFFSSAFASNYDEDLIKTWQEGTVYVPGKIFSTKVKNFKTDNQFPVVLYLHGCAGISPSNDTPWARLLKSNGYLVIMPNSFARKGKTFSCDIPKNIRPSLSDGLLRIDELKFALEEIKSARWFNGTIFIMGHSQGAWAAAMIPLEESSGVVLSSLTSCTRRINIKDTIPVLRIGYKNDPVDLRPVLDCDLFHKTQNFKDHFVNGFEHDTYLNKELQNLVLNFLKTNDNTRTKYGK